MFNQPSVSADDASCRTQQPTKTATADPECSPHSRDITSRFEDLRAPHFDLEHLTVTIPEALEAYANHRDELNQYRQRAISREELSFGARLVLIALPPLSNVGEAKRLSRVELDARQDSDLSGSPYSYLKQATLRLALVGSASVSAIIGFNAAEAPLKLMLDLIATPTLIGFIWACVALSRFSIAAKQQVQFTRNLQKTLVELLRRNAED